MTAPDHSLPSPRRSFLRRLAWLSGMFALVLRGKTLAQETTPACDAEVAKLKDAVVEARLEAMRDKARYVRRFHEKFGSGILDEAKKLTIVGAENWMKDADLAPEERNLAEVKRFYARETAFVACTWVEDTPERLQARVTRCRWAEELKKDGNDGELGFALLCAGDIGYCAGLNPGMKFSRTKTLMMGDDHCNHTYELKS